MIGIAIDKLLIPKEKKKKKKIRFSANVLNPALKNALGAAYPLHSSIHGMRVSTSLGGNDEATRY